MSHLDTIASPLTTRNKIALLSEKSKGGSDQLRGGRFLSGRHLLTQAAGIGILIGQLYSYYLFCSAEPALKLATSAPPRQPVAA